MAGRSRPSDMTPTLRTTRRLVAVALALLLAACGRAPIDADTDVGHGVLLVVVDGLRADHLGCYGHDRDTSPYLDALAERGVLFESAFAAAPRAEASLAALVSGCDPNLARRRLPGVAGLESTHTFALSEVLPSAAVEFAVEGYRTAAFVDGEAFDGVRGIARGFHEVRRVDDPAERRERGPLEDAIDWVRARDLDEPWFACVQLSDLMRAFVEPHPEWDSFFEPRTELWWIPPVGANAVNFHAVPPERWAGGTLPLSHYDARYDGAIRKLDSELKRLFDLLESAGRFKRTTVCVTGTHGLQFGEAGMLLDHGLLSPADVHVPLVVRPAQRLEHPFEAGARRRGAASGVDLAPTLLDLAGIAVPPSMHGRSLAPRLGRADTEEDLARTVMVSCGLVTGTAAYTHELVVEHLVPGVDLAPQLREQWLGRDALGGLEVRCYPWRDPDAKPLASVGVPAEHAVEAARLTAAQDAWFQTFVIDEYERVWGTP